MHERELPNFSISEISNSTTKIAVVDFGKVKILDNTGNEFIVSDSLDVQDLGITTDSNSLSLDKREGFSFSGLSWSPDGRYLAFAKFNVSEEKKLIVVVDTYEATSKTIASYEGNPQFISNNILAFTTPIETAMGFARDIEWSLEGDEFAVDKFSQYSYAEPTPVRDNCGMNYSDQLSLQSSLDEIWLPPYESTQGKTSSWIIFDWGYFGFWGGILIDTFPFETEESSCYQIVRQYDPKHDPDSYKLLHFDGNWFVPDKDKTLGYSAGFADNTIITFDRLPDSSENFLIGRIKLNIELPKNIQHEFYSPGGFPGLISGEFAIWSAEKPDIELNGFDQLSEETIVTMLQESKREFPSIDTENITEMQRLDFWDRIKNAQIPSLCEHPPSQLVNGIDPNLSSGEGVLELDQDTLVYGLESSLYGKLVAVKLYCDRGGVFWPNAIMIFRENGTYHDTVWLDPYLDDRDNGEAGAIISFWDGVDVIGPGRSGVESLATANGALVVSLRVELPEDPGQCCPSGLAEVFLEEVDSEIKVTRVIRKK